MPVAFTVDTQSFDDTKAEFRRFVENVPSAERSALAHAGGLLTAAIRANISVPAIGGSPKSHSAALAAMDHPYSKRRGRIQLAPSSGGYPGFRRRKLLVHTVSGELLSALNTRLDPGVGFDSNASVTVGVDPSIAPHAEWVFSGTSAMHARDILNATATDPAVRRDVRRVLVTELKRAMGFRR